MKANVVAFESPTPKLYMVLPLPREDMDDVAAILFTGPAKPTADDFKRTPLLVHCKEVKLALEWLILNHLDYEDVKISDNNLNSYDENIPPCSVEYKFAEHNKNPEGISVFDMNDENGTLEGECPSVVHSITEENLSTYTVNQLKAKAWQHFNAGSKVLAVGHANECKSIWKNPRLYSKMFSHLFSYGLGYLDSSESLTDNEH
ncbi:hypothetical protein GYMLUDRAFT_148313 [Collybiopsis luxurians FD-317 M1]|nr:hypothetical protein GYMLUDRAFT_148313 [Collybiopsis luxurians FD-317 M1]